MDTEATKLLSMETDRTGTELRRSREARGLSFRELGALLFCDHTKIAHIESGRRWPKDRAWVESADIALGAAGRLVAAWDADQREHARHADTMRMLEQARIDSESFLALPDAADLDEIQAGVHDIATGARFEPYDITLTRASDLRVELMRRVRVGAHSPDELRTLYAALGRVCGVLAYLTLDLGQAETARMHAHATFKLGDRADHDQLRAWSRGTQALAFRFDKNFEQAARAASDGLRYTNNSTGTAEARLLCGLAASVANLGDSGRALELLDDAERARDRASMDEFPGLFTFTPAKQIYYRGFSLMWAEDPKTLNRSAKASQDAIAAWQVQRSPGDEMLSHIYLATANARLGDLDGSIAAVTPVLENPISAHFSWVRKRLRQLDRLLGEHFPDSVPATGMRETLGAYILAR
ncbi:helix-turn-helix transcriptional regulator [Nocardia sp. AG03]|uniref:helix-turn-helix domain-containing protein n=1 Tax=Nocardia sp. AG03 TaxID=3025312 RepID=UPI002418294E|nr:helix-turn-helix transcriptional regulator [Nocardia sp. AG03]